MQQHRILVIEDQEDIAALYEKSLEQAGYKVKNAFSGEEGVAEFEADGADCVLLDITLPEMNGAATLAELRRTNATVPVIMITGETSEETRSKCERLGVFAYIPKPLDLDVLLSNVAHALAVNLTDEDYKIVTLRLPARTLATLTAINPNIDHAIRQLCDECAAEVEASASSAKASA